jgi:O-methyltransferase involved in polyketide biosynthesis
VLLAVYGIPLYRRTTTRVKRGLSVHSPRLDGKGSEAISSSLGSARNERDSWDLASSLGVTATFVAARRALALRGPQALIDDRFAGPLVRAVGHEFFPRLLDGEIAWDDATFTEQQVREQIAVRTRFFDDFFLDASAPGSRIATEQLPDMSAFTDQCSRAWRQRWRQYGLDVDGAELVWDGEHSDVGEYLSSNGWQVSIHHAPELYAANGFEFPSDEAVASFGSFDYLIAEMRA